MTEERRIGNAEEVDGCNIPVFCIYRNHLWAPLISDFKIGIDGCKIVYSIDTTINKATKEVNSSYTMDISSSRQLCSRSVTHR